MLLNRKSNLLLSAVVAVTAFAGTALADDAAPPAEPGQDTTAPAAQTQPPAPPPVEQTPEQVAADDKIVCKTMDPPAGSRIGGRRVCHSVREWRSIQATAHDAVRDIQDKGSMQKPPGG